MIAFVIVGSDGGVVDGISVLFEPCTNGVETSDCFGLNQTFGRWTHTEDEIASFCHDFNERIDDAHGGFPARTWYPTPIVCQRDATFPRVVELGFGNGLFGCLIVFVWSMDGAVNNEDARLMGTSHGSNARHVDVLVCFWTNPTAIEPKNIDRTVTAEDFFYLIVSVLLETFPTPRPALDVVIHLSSAFDGIDIPPIVLAVPVGLGEVGANHELLIAEGGEYVLKHIAFGIVPECVLSDGVISESGVKHTESIVVLGGENHIFHPCTLHDFCPLRRIELSGVELIGKSPIPILVLLIGHCGVASNPLLIADRPTLHDTWHGIDAPMKKDTKLEVLPRMEFVENLRVGWPFVGGGLSVEIVLLGRECETEEKEKVSKMFFHGKRL